MVPLQSSSSAAAGDPLMLAVESSAVLVAKTSTPQPSGIQLDESNQSTDTPPIESTPLPKMSPPSSTSKSDVYSRIPTPVGSTLSKTHVKLATPEAGKNGKL